MKENEQLNHNFRALEIFAWCKTCLTLLIGAEKHNSFWGKRVTTIANLHRRATKHDVYVGKNKSS